MANLEVWDRFASAIEKRNNEYEAALADLADLRARLAESEARTRMYHRALFVVRSTEWGGCDHGHEVACVRCETVLAMEKRGACGCAPEHGLEHWPDCPLREVTTRADAQTVLIELVGAVNGVEAAAQCAAIQPAMTTTP